VVLESLGGKKVEIDYGLGLLLRYLCEESGERGGEGSRQDGAE
jgi:hypothetical protein